MAIDYKIGPIIKYHRKKAGITQKKLAELAGVGKTVIFDIEKGKQSVRLDTLLKILHVLNMRMEFNGPIMNEAKRSINEKS